MRKRGTAEGDGRGGAGATDGRKGGGEKERPIYNAFASLQGPQPVEAVNVACISYETPPPPGCSSQCQSRSFARLIIPSANKVNPRGERSVSSSFVVPPPSASVRLFCFLCFHGLFLRAFRAIRHSCASAAPHPLPIAGCFYVSLSEWKFLQFLARSRPRLATRRTALRRDRRVT